MHTVRPSLWSWCGSVISTLIACVMGPTWGPSGADRTQMGPILAPWTLLSDNLSTSIGIKIIPVPEDQPWWIWVKHSYPMWWGWLKTVTHTKRHGHVLLEMCLLTIYLKLLFRKCMFSSLNHISLPCVPRSIWKITGTGFPNGVTSNKGYAITWSNTDTNAH